MSFFIFMVLNNMRPIIDIYFKCILFKNQKCNQFNIIYFILIFSIAFQSKKKVKDQESIQSSTTPDPG